jgi:tetratricopeptide (TPR) repeat protein
MHPFVRPVLVRILIAFAAPALPAQAPPLVLPEASPRAQIVQQVGLTEISLAYHRPAVNSRPVWGQLVPYDQVWRAGANENTVLSFSTPVTIGGTTLPAGRYGLHMLPTATEWTVILSSQSHAWGSFSYDVKEDVARVKVTPLPAEFTERLAYTFDDPSDGAVTLALHWDKLQVPLRLVVDTKREVVASLRDQLRGLPRFFPEGWSAAAAWCLRNDVNLDEALAWADRALAMRETFGNLRLKAGLLEKRGRGMEAETLQAKAMGLATEADLNQFGYALLGQKKVDEALAVFQQNVKAHPASWNVYDSLAEAYAIKGEKALAVENYRKAQGMVQQADQKARIDGELAKLK